jgi:hypothetical protein
MKKIILIPVVMPPRKNRKWGKVIGNSNVPGGRIFRCHHSSNGAEKRITPNPARERVLTFLTSS